MNYLRPHKKRRTFIFALLILLLAVSIFIFQPTVPKFLSQSLHTLGIPIWRAKNTLSANVYSIFSLFSAKRSLLEENALLRRERDRLQLELLLASALQGERERLEDAVREIGDGNTILAAVLLKPNITPYDTLIVDAGENKGVAKGDWALTESSLILGTVTEVYRQSSLVTLFSSPGVETSIVVGSSHIQATAKGKGGGNFETALPRGVPVFEGDTILMPGIEPLLFGTVEKVLAAPSDSFQTILFKSPVNIFELYYVELAPR